MDIFYFVLGAFCAALVVVNLVGVIRANNTTSFVLSIVGVFFAALGVGLSLLHFGVFA